MVLQHYKHLMFLAIDTAIERCYRRGVQSINGDSMTILDRIRANPGMPITTANGLREAVWDVIHDETNGTFTAKWLGNRLPYDYRLRQILREFVAEGVVIRIDWGIYKIA